MLDCIGADPNMTPQDEAEMQREVQEFMNGLDRDGNGLLDLDEFVAFVVGKLAQTPEERRDFAEQSRMHAKLSEMIIAMTDKIAASLGKGNADALLGKSMYNDLPEKTEGRIEYAVENLFGKYDADKSGAIEAGEFLTLMGDVMGAEGEGAAANDRLPTLADAKRFIPVIANKKKAGGDGVAPPPATLLERQDFIDFSLTVMTSTSDQRIRFSSQSRMHHKLLSFFLVLIVDALEAVDNDIDRAEYDKRQKKKQAEEARKKRSAEEAAKRQAEEASRQEAEQAAEQAQQRAKAERERLLEEKYDDGKDDDEDMDEAEYQRDLAAMQANITGYDENNEPTFITPEQRREVLLSRLDAYTLFAWSRFDLDKDGNLNAVEFEAFLRHIAQRDDVTTEDCQRFLRQMDQSGDGLIQRDELVQFAGAWFSGGYPFVVGSIQHCVIALLV